MELTVYHVIDTPWDTPQDIELKKERWAYFMATSPDRAITYISPSERTTGLTLIEGVINVDDDKMITALDPIIDIKGTSFHLHKHASKANYHAKSVGFDIIHVSNDFGADDIFLLNKALFTPQKISRRTPSGAWSKPQELDSINSQKPVDKEVMLACISMHNEEPEKLSSVLSAVANKYGISNIELGRAFQGLLSGDIVNHHQAVTEMLPQLPLADFAKENLYAKLTGNMLDTSPAHLTPPEPLNKQAAPVHTPSISPRSPGLR